MAKKQRREKEEPDRLAEAVVSRKRKETILGRELTIHKWNLRRTAEIGKRFRELFAALIGKISLGGAAMFQMDLFEMFSDKLDEIVEIDAATILEDNFDSLEEAKEWVETLGYESVELLVIIAEMNFRPLVATGARAKKLIERLVGSDVGGVVQRVLQQQTSSQPSSPKVTPTK